MSAKEQDPNLAEFLKLAKPKRPPCAIGVVLSQLPEQEAQQLQSACEADNTLINVGAIVEWLQLRGHKVSQQRVLNHRLGRCACHD